MKILIATRNKAKLTELQNMLQNINITVVGLNETTLSPSDEPNEPCMTFEGNALVKAFYYSSVVGVLTLAEDSGLEVDTLHGAPGVYSARFALGSDKDRYMRLLEVMKDVPAGERGAQFRTVIALHDKETNKVRTCEGICRGNIALEPRGENGFGYDPVFIAEGKDVTNGELTTLEKNAISHRGKALAHALEILKNDFQIL